MQLSVMIDCYQFVLSLRKAAVVFFLFSRLNTMFQINMLIRKMVHLNR